MFSSESEMSVLKGRLNYSKCHLISLSLWNCFVFGYLACLIENQRQLDLNESGEVLVRDKENNIVLWVPHNTIKFSQDQHPHFLNNEERIQVTNVEDAANDGLLYETTENNSQMSESETSQNRNFWSHEQTIALISAIEERYDDMHHVHKRKTFWNVISEVLNSVNVLFSDQACKKKWLNLLRTYKSTKDNKTKTGRGPTRFIYFERLDELLGDTPTYSSPHSLEVGEKAVGDKGATVKENEGRSLSANSEKKRKNPSIEVKNMKKIYYEKKIQQMEKKEEFQHAFLEECLRDKREKTELLRKKIELKERMVLALEQMMANKENVECSE